jgi:nucleotide-binding universal stress UspA family protein
MYDRILIPLDGSSLGDAAIRVAKLIPSRLIYLLQVEDDTPETVHTMGPGGGEVSTRWLGTAVHEHLERAATDFRDQGREVEVIRVAGDRAQRIIETAADVDLIIMATHARGPAGRAILGSVSDRVVREGPTPTLLVRGDYQLASPPLTRIVVPLDGSSLAEQALPVAVELGNALALRVHVVRVIEPARDRPTAAAVRPGERAKHASSSLEAARAELQERVARLPDDDVIVTSEVRSGPVVSELRASIRPRDLVVMTTHGRSGVRRLVLGSVADALVRGASAPILLVRASLAAATATRSTDEASEVS